jgi:hypothetical protein
MWQSSLPAFTFAKKGRQALDCNRHSQPSTHHASFTPRPLLVNRLKSYISPNQVMADNENETNQSLEP